jgi:predicted nucleotidyltransferase
MIELGPVQVDEQRVAELCRRYRVKELSVFGSVARGDWGPNSDIDLLVEFVPNSGIGLIEYAGLMRELSDLMGRKVDLVSKRALKPLIRDSVLGDARLVYAA